MAQGRLRVGTSGFHYTHWRGRFYPPEIPASRWLAYYARHFDGVEINNTFYRLPEARAFDAWRAQVPADFCFALKLSRYVTHVKRLQAPRAALRRFVTRARRLGERLGPILVQLPPRWRPDLARLTRFLEALSPELRWALELRDPRWLGEPLYERLRAHGVALCIHDLLEEHPREVTASWVYLRYHGQDYGGSYTTAFLRAEARRIRAWLDRGLDVYAFFNNDRDAWAVENARDLARLLARRPPGARGARRARPRGG